MVLCLGAYMRRLLSVGLTAILILGCCFATTSGARANDAEACVKTNGDERIDACTRVISASKSGNLAWAYRNRGLAWHAKGDEDRALADFNEAVRVDLKF